MLHGVKCVTYSCTCTIQPIITDYMTSASEGLELVKKEQRLKEREATKRISEALKALCDT